MQKLNAFLLVTLFCSAGLTWAAKQPHVVVFPLKAEGVSKQSAILVTERIRTLLGRSGRVKILERNEIDKILETVGFNFDDITDERGGIEVGRLLNAHKIVSGSITRIGKRVILSANYLDVETSLREIPASLDLGDIPDDQIIDYAVALVDQIIDRIPIEGKILEADSDTVIVDIGSETGIKIGATLTVDQIKEIRDPETGEIRKIPQRVGRLKVVDFAGKEYAKCVVLNVSPTLRTGMKVQTEMVSITVQKQRRRRRQAIIASTIIPGRGQIIYKQHRGWIYLAGVGGALGMSAYSWMQYNDARDNYDTVLERYYINPSDELFQELKDAHDDKSKWRDRIIMSAIVAGGVWAWSVVDAWLWGGGETADFANDGANEPKLALIVCPRQVGISLRF